MLAGWRGMVAVNRRRLVAALFSEQTRQHNITNDANGGHPLIHGVVCNVPYTDPTNTEIAMERAPDRYRYVLDRPIVAEPGKTWIYCGGATALLGRMIAKGTGKPLHAYAREALFDPAGIAVTEWAKGADGNESAASGVI